GGDVVRIENGSGVHLPRIVAVRSSDTYHGDDWLGLRTREASVVGGIGVLPAFGGLIGRLLLVRSLAGTWMRAGRWDARHVAVAAFPVNNRPETGKPRGRSFRTAAGWCLPSC